MGKRDDMKDRFALAGDSDPSQAAGVQSDVDARSNEAAQSGSVGAEEFSDNETMQAFPQFSHLSDLDDDQRVQAFTEVLSQLRHRLDEITER